MDRRQRASQTISLFEHTNKQLKSLTHRMRLLLTILCIAFCSGFRVSDLLEPFIGKTNPRSSSHYPSFQVQGYPENAAESEDEDLIFPVFLITFIGALFKNILIAEKKEEVVQGKRFHSSFLLHMYICCGFQIFFPAVLITGGFASGKSGSSAEIYIPSNSSSCVLPRLPVFRKHSGIISRHSFFSFKCSDLITRLTEAWHVVTRVVTFGILRLGHGA